MKSAVITYTLAVTLTALAAVVGAPRAVAASRAPLWETVETVDESDTVAVGGGDDANAGFEVTLRDGRIYITVDRPVKVEVFSILGQLVTSRTISAGTVRLTLGNRGIYIVKGAGSTRRINL